LGEEITGMNLAPKTNDFGTETVGSGAGSPEANGARLSVPLAGTAATDRPSAPYNMVATFNDATSRPEANDFTATLTWVGPRVFPPVPDCFHAPRRSANSDEAVGIPLVVAVAAFADALRTLDVNDFTAILTADGESPFTEPVVEEEIVTDSDETWAAETSVLQEEPSSSEAAVLVVDDEIESVGIDVAVDDSVNAEVFAPSAPAEGAAEPTGVDRVGEAPAPLSILSFTAPSPIEGAEFRQPMVTFTAAETLADLHSFTAVINWGDGSKSILTAANEGIDGVSPFRVIGDHTYTTSGQFLLSVQILDRTGASTSTSCSILVRSAPVPPAPPPQAGPMPDLSPQTVVVGAPWNSSVIDVAPAMGPRPSPQPPPPAVAGPPPMPPVPPHSVPSMPTGRAPQHVSQEQVTDLVFQMGVANGANAGRGVSQAALYDYMASHPAMQARIVEVQDQIFLSVSQALANQQAKSGGAGKTASTAPAQESSPSGDTPAT
jgi:hypothetical protein